MLAKVKIIEDDLGWDVQYVCEKCNKTSCTNSFNMWIPNKKGNIEDGLNEEELWKEINICFEKRNKPCDKV